MGWVVRGGPDSMGRGIEAWRGAALCGMAWYGMVHGIARHGTARHIMTRRHGAARQRRGVIGIWLASGVMMA